MDGEYTPTYFGSITEPGANSYEAAAGRYIVADGVVRVRGTVVFHADTHRYQHELDRARRALDRLRYPPKTPAKGSVSRRIMKLRRAGLR